MTYEEIFEQVKTELMKSDVSQIPDHLAVQVDIVGEGEGAFYIELKDGTLFVEPYEYYDHDVKLIITAKNFLKLISGSLNAVVAYTTGKLKIEGDLGKAMEVQKIIESVKKSDSKKSASKKSKK